MTELSLFPDLGPTIAERIREIDLRIEKLLSGSLSESHLALSGDEKAVLRSIRYRRGAANAISIREMITSRGCARSDRQIKQIVRTLRIQYRLPIGSSKSGNGGYFVMISAEDHAILSAQILDQVRAELQALKATSGPRTALELLGQLRIEIEADAWEVR